jgi:predicted transposase/invertase (TIGR01784 family)
VSNLPQKGANSERVKLDEILKSLFTVSSKVLINMLNSLFKENYAAEATEVSFASNEFVDDAYNILRGDLFLKLSDAEKSNHYHIEIQTLNDDSKVIRMLEYGISKAKENAKYEGDQEETVFYIPKQLVIFIEQNSSIKDELRLRLIFPDGQEVKYRVPVMKYWEYSKEEILEQKLYPLLPLQVFKLRYQMEKIKQRKTHTEQELRELIQEAQQIVETISHEAVRLFRAEEIDGEDLHKILLANEELFRYLNGRYVKDERLNEEVLSMTRTLYDPVVEERGKMKGKLEGKLEGKMEAARNALKKGFSIEDITEITGLPLETVQKLKAEL